MNKKLQMKNYLDALYKIDRMYENGMAYVSEDESLKKLIPEIGLGDGNFGKTNETSYRDILEHNNLSWNHEFNSPRVDYENNKRKLLIEYKTLNKQYQMGKIDEYLPKKLFDDAATHSYINPFPQNNQQSVGSQSVIGDIEKLLLLPESYTRMIILHLWDNEIYPADTHLDMLDWMVNKYYDVDGCTFQYNDSINDMSTRCNIVVYKIKGKRGL
jgi:hypothetical protein|tara:strand:+ start:119 stop:760 length:642 start_codon:yes stop_codon:yes gene_type:complete